VGHRQALRALADYWPEVVAQLSADTVIYLAELIERYGRAGPAEANNAESEIGRVLDQVLPHDDHPLRIALDSPVRRGASADPPDRVSLLRVMEDTNLIGDAAPDPSSAEVTFWTERWLLGESAVTEDDLVIMGTDPDNPDLIKLDRDDGGSQWPAFQFGADGQVLSQVATVNRLLGSLDDPWGTASWWLGHNRWLEGVPARLLGTVADELLIAAAEAVDPGV
jgi:hypothetical protein